MIQLCVNYSIFIQTMIPVKGNELLRTLHQQIQQSSTFSNHCLVLLIQYIIQLVLEIFSMNLDTTQSANWISLDKQIQKTANIITALKKQKDQHSTTKSRFLIGVCGIPGSGKSTISQKLSHLLPNSVVLPLDGFHILRKLLTEQGILRRGAAFTFDLSKFEKKILQIRKGKIEQTIKYPNFNHKEKDPVEDSILISSTTQIIIVQGLYVFDKNLKLNQTHTKGSAIDKVWDFKIWVKSQLDASILRVARRHLQSGIEPTFQLAQKRANCNDRTNALYVIENCFDYKQFVKASDTSLGNSNSGVMIDNSINLQIGSGDEQK